VAAGITASWYFTPEQAMGFWSVAVRGSVMRSFTTSFGSICLGALLVAVIQLLELLVKNLRNNRREREERRGGLEDLLLCCLDCILRLVEDIVQYFNKWAFVYVGIYGYTYLTAGKMVMSLFEQRGWSIITDDYLCSIAINLLGLLLVVLSVVSTTLILVIADVNIITSGFHVGVAIVVILVAIVLSIINSAVCTIIVCFAEAPVELDRNHGTHSREMREAWQKAFPMLHF